MDQNKLYKRHRVTQVIYCRRSSSIPATLTPGPLVNVYISMENHHAINGKTPYKLQFSIAMLVYQRVQGFDPCFDDGTSTPVEGPKLWLKKVVWDHSKKHPPSHRWKSWKPGKSWKCITLYHHPGNTTVYLFGDHYMRLYVISTDVFLDKKKSTAQWTTAPRAEAKVPQQVKQGQVFPGWSSSNVDVGQNGRPRGPQMLV